MNKYGYLLDPIVNMDRDPKEWIDFDQFIRALIANHEHACVPDDLVKIVDQDGRILYGIEISPEGVLKLTFVEKKEEV